MHVAENQVHVHEPPLPQFSTTRIDHEKLTYRYSGRDSLHPTTQTPQPNGPLAEEDRRDSLRNLTSARKAVPGFPPAFGKQLSASGRSTGYFARMLSSNSRSSFSRIRCRSNSQVVRALIRMSVERPVQGHIAYQKDPFLTGNHRADLARIFYGKAISETALLQAPSLPPRCITRQLPLCNDWQHALNNPRSGQEPLLRTAGQTRVLRKPFPRLPKLFLIPRQPLGIRTGLSQRTATWRFSSD